MAKEITMPTMGADMTEGTIVKWLKQEGNLSNFELARTFNCGIGMLIYVTADTAEAALQAIKLTGEDAYMVGEMVERTFDAVILNDIDKAFA